MMMLSSSDFARMRGISDRVARKAFAQRRYCGHQLPIVETVSARGGNGGRVLRLNVNAASPSLLELIGVTETALSMHVESRIQTRPDDRHVTVASDRQRIIAPILTTKRGTSERAQIFREIAAQPAHQIGGKLQSVAERTLRDWVTAAESSGPASLSPKLRADRGKARTLITRDWDKQIDLSDDEKQRIAHEIALKARSMVANDGTSEREARRICESRLFHHCREAGSQLPQPKLRRLCKLNAKWGDRQELKKFNLVYLKNKDHKAFQDSAVPRISRELHPMPMGLLVGDVHYVDLLVKEDDETIRVRLIHWMDASSLFVWTTPVFLSKGQGAGQEDVAEALWQVSSCRHGGIPQQYYLDNGSEYAALTDAMMRLSYLADMDFGVTLAKPYSPTSKGDIEGHFNILEHIFKGLPGWIGGDRTNKKSQNKGQVTQPYCKGLAALEADIQAAVAIYNDRPQSGRLDGLSPLEMLDRKIAETGFEARFPSEESFDLIFSKSKPKTIRQNAIEHASKKWRSPLLDGLSYPPKIGQ
ncbi:MAG: hypothetical protein ACK5LJ_14885 [Paracoccus sp. (in: a-proteobacteria)]